MSDEDAMVAAAAMILVEVAASQHQRRPRRFWIRPSLIHGRSKYNTTEFMKDLLLDEVDDLKLEYRCDAGFRNFFRMKSSEFIKNDCTNHFQTRHDIQKSHSCERTLCCYYALFSYWGFVYFIKLYVSKQIISSIIPDVCDAICSVLEGEVKVRKILPNQTQC
ncbi:hypothetical protein JTB14_007656 [Gonioctena quinquepunctata]|nr:hypothetical protein JTB14_007656 [Gonioctena quinquepunctata]